MKEDRIHNPGMQPTLKLVFAALAVAGVVFNLSTGCSPFSPLTFEEARTFYFADNYFTISILLPFFNAEMPLYYMLAHFVSFLPGDTAILRLLSVVFFVLYCVGFFTLLRDITNRVDETKGQLSSFPLLFIASIPFIPFLLYFCMKATPVSFSAMLVIFSILYFYRAYIRGEEDYRKYFTAFTTAALYSTLLMFPLSIAQWICAGRTSSTTGKTRQGRTPEEFRKIFLYFLPGLFMWILGGIKQIFLLMNGLQDATAPAVSDVIVRIFGLYDIADVSPAGPAISILIVVIFIPACLYISLSKPKMNTGKWSAVPATAAACLSIGLCLISGSVVAKRTSLDRATATMIERLELEEGEDDTLIAFVRDRDYYLFRRVFHGTGLRYLIYPDPERNSGKLDLGGIFEPVAEAGIRRPEEMFLGSEKVWIITARAVTYREGHPDPSGRNIRTEKVYEEFQRWNKDTVLKGENVPAGYSVSGEKYKYSIQPAVLKPGFTADGILLHLFVNHFHDNEKAVKLLNEPDFEPGDLEAYFFDDSPGAVETAVANLAATCEKNLSCRKRVLDKIVEFASGSSSRDSLRRTCLEAVMPLYTKLLEKLEAGESGKSNRNH